MWKGAGLSCLVSSVYFVLWSLPSVSSVSLLFLLLSSLCSSSSSSLPATAGKPVAGKPDPGPECASSLPAHPDAQRGGGRGPAGGAICSASGSSRRCRSGQWQPLDLWTDAGEGEGNGLGPGPTLPPHYHFSESFLKKISVELEYLTPF